MLDLFFEVFGELIFALGWESVAAAFQRRSEAHPVLARIGYLLIGAALGALSGVAFPRRLSQHDGVSLLGVLLNPLLFGLISFFYGERRRRQERMTTHLSTFWGGALFAFGLSAARLAAIVLGD